MGEIINLRQVRRQKARAEREASALENRIRFGRTKAERIKENADAVLAHRRLEAAKRDVPEDGT